MSMSEALTKALPLLYALERRGYETVFVGGCVRDTLLGKPLKDIDIATAALPEQVMAVFPQTIPTGLQHGTVTVVQEKETYEVTTFRTESAYERFRRPAQVEFVTALDEDLRRRDFTINSMAMRSDGAIVDPFGGQDDLRRRRLRCVGDADARLQEDALRIVRAVRFAAAYDLRIAPMTWRAIIRYRERLVHIAMERVGLELDKMIAGSRPNRAAALLASSGMLAWTKERLPAAMLDAAEAYAKAKAVRRHAAIAESPLAVASAGTGAAASAGRRMALIARTMRRLHLITDSEDRWAAVCAALSLRGGQASELFGLLKYSSQRSARLAAIMGLHEAMSLRLLSHTDAADAARDVMIAEETGIDSRTDEPELRAHWRLSVLKHGKPAAAGWLAVVGAIPELAFGTAGIGERVSSAEAKLNRLRESLQTMPACSVKELAVKGKDLLSLAGKPSGPWLGALLQRLLEAAALGRVPNERESLLAEAAALLQTKEREIE